MATYLYDFTRPSHYDYISPGVVGSVGDALVQTQLSRSSPEEALRFEHSETQIKQYGTHVQDGSSRNFYGYGAGTCLDSNWQGKRDFKTSVGWRQEDVRAPDTRKESAQSYSFSSFDNLNASVIRSQRPQNLALPNGYSPIPGVQPRGGNVPRITDLAGGDFTPGANSVVTNPIMSAPNNSNLHRGPELKLGIQRQAHQPNLIQMDNNLRK